MRDQEQEPGDASKSKPRWRFDRAQVWQPVMAGTRPIWIAGISAGLSALAAAYLLLSATASASLRHWRCGPSSLDHPEAWCQTGTKLLLASYGAGALTLLLVVLALWLHTRRLKGADHSLKPRRFAARPDSG